MVDSHPNDFDRKFVNNVKGRTVAWWQGGEMMRTACPADVFEVPWVPMSEFDEALRSFESMISDDDMELFELHADGESFGVVVVMKDG